MPMAHKSSPAENGRRIPPGPSERPAPKEKDAKKETDSSVSNARLNKRIPSLASRGKPGETYRRGGVSAYGRGIATIHLLFRGQGTSVLSRNTRYFAGGQLAVFKARSEQDWR
jgi:hypothetical protein